MFGYFIVRIFSKLKDNLGESIVIKLFAKLSELNYKNCILK